MDTAATPDKYQEQGRARTTASTELRGDAATRQGYVGERTGYTCGSENSQ